MGHLKMVVDHQKIDYSGPVDVHDLLRVIENFLWEKGYDKQINKDFEINTHNGKFIEWQYFPWKKISDYASYHIKIRILGYDIVKTDASDNGKRKKVDTGRLIIVTDAYLLYDYDSYWDSRPFLFFLRTIYDYFVFKSYTERFEHMLTHDINHLQDAIEKFLNLYRSYSVISHPAH